MKLNNIFRISTNKSLKKEDISMIYSFHLKSKLDVTRPPRSVNATSNPTPSLMHGIRKKMKRNSILGGVAMIALAILFAILSFFTKSFVFEADSVVSFIAALLLFTIEQSDTVQKRVVGKVLDSIDRILAELTPSSPDDYDVLFVPISTDIDGVVTLLKPVGQNGVGETASPFTLTPLGRGLAELSLREIGMTNPSVEYLLDSLPHIITGELALATGMLIRSISDEEYEFILTRPVVLNGASGLRPKFITSITGSLFGVLLAHASQRNVSVVGYDTDSVEGTERIVLKLEDQKSDLKEGSLHA